MNQPFSILHIKHHEFAAEAFSVASAEFNYYEIAGSDLIEFIIRVETDEAITRDKKLASLFNGDPHIEATIVFKKSEFILEEGTSLFQEFGYDEDRDVNLTNLYYFAHVSIEKLAISLLAVSETSMKASVNGVSAVNSGDWQAPDAEIHMEGVFERNNELKRSFD